MRLTLLDHHTQGEPTTGATGSAQGGRHRRYHRSLTIQLRIYGGIDAHVILLSHHLWLPSVEITAVEHEEFIMIHLFTSLVVTSMLLIKELKTD